jgi:hypothetical protein
MKLSTTSFCIFISLLTLHFSCTERDISLKKTEFTKDEALKMLETNFMHIEKVERKSGSQTVDLSNLEPYKTSIENSFLTFRSGSVLLISGSKLANDQFLPSTQTFVFQNKILVPLYINYAWDEASGTVVARSTSQSTTYGIPANQNSSLDLSSIISYNTFEEAKSASVVPSFKFTYSTDDKDLGSVTYTYTLKPVWGYAAVPNVPNTNYYVMF